MCRPQLAADKSPPPNQCPGAPIDNNICERALKKAICHRRNSLFYRTSHGASVGDMFTSLIHTAELHGANPFDYLTNLQRHSNLVAGQSSRLAALELSRNPDAARFYLNS